MFIDIQMGTLQFRTGCCYRPRYYFALLDMKPICVNYSKDCGAQLDQRGER